MQHQAHCPTHQAAKAIKSILKSAACLEQQLENEYQKRERAETDAATLRRTMNEMEEDREILMKKLDKKTRDLEMSHASDEQNQRELAAHKRFRGPDLDETIKAYFGGKEHPDLALQIRFTLCTRTRRIKRKETQSLRGTTRYAASPLEARAAAHDTFAGAPGHRTSAREHAHVCGVRAEQYRVKATMESHRP